MLENLSTKIQKILRELKGEGRVTEQHIQVALREIRLALLEADVHYKIVKDFVSRVSRRALGQEVLGQLLPGQHVVKVVRDELVATLGSEASPLEFSKIAPSVFLLVGLQGSGKTTTTGKLALWLRTQNRRPMVVSTDVYRPAAREQLAVVSEGIQVPAYEGSGDDPVQLGVEALQVARNGGFDVLLVDTAGRLHIDDELMEELSRMRDTLRPVEVLLVADAMTGQDAVKSARSFDNRLNLSGVILTKLDGDARGGAAISITSVTAKPIKFIGVGEKYDALEVFHPERMADRILGMGDVLSLIERAEQTVDQEQAERMVQKLRNNQFTLEDFLQQIQQLKKLGPLDQILEMLPQTGPLKGLDKVRLDDRQLSHVEAIIRSMTLQERANHKTINASRRRRISKGSGRPVSEVNRLLKQYVQMRKMMGRAGKGLVSRGLSKLRFPI